MSNFISRIDFFPEDSSQKKTSNIYGVFFFFYLLPSFHTAWPLNLENSLASFRRVNNNGLIVPHFEGRITKVACLRLTKYTKGRELRAPETLTLRSQNAIRRLFVPCKIVPGVGIERQSLTFVSLDLSIVH